jgi:hypothetical protein
MKPKPEYKISGIDIAGWYNLLFSNSPPKDLTLAEILAEIFEKNPQVYHLIERELRLTNPDRFYPMET